MLAAKPSSAGGTAGDGGWGTPTRPGNPGQGGTPASRKCCYQPFKTKSRQSGKQMLLFDESLFLIWLEMYHTYGGAPYYGVTNRYVYGPTVKPRGKRFRGVETHQWVVARRYYQLLRPVCVFWGAGRGIHLSSRFVFLFLACPLPWPRPASGSAPSQNGQPAVLANKCRLPTHKKRRTL